MISIYVIRIIVNAVQKMLGNGNMDLITNMNAPCTMDEVQTQTQTDGQNDKDMNKGVQKICVFPEVFLFFHLSLASTGLLLVIQKMINQ